MGPRAYKIVLGRPDLTVTSMGATLNETLAINSCAAFTGTDKDAAVAGDVVMLPTEVNPVTHALEANELSVFAVHNHMFDENPRLIFLHYGRGAVAKLATGFRAAIDQLAHGPGGAAPPR